MNSQDLKEKISKLPDAPGVYFFKHGKEILYIGKATSLRDRVRSYFSGKIEETRGPLISKMLGEFDEIAFQKTDSVLEALILEAHLIKKHQPPANILEKDDRSFNYVTITDEDFPRVLIMRQRELEKFFLGTSLENHGNFLLKISSVRRRRSSRGFSQEDASKNFSIKHIFGPFPNGSQLKEAMKIVRRMFPFRDKCLPNQNKPCFNRQIGLCLGVCTGEISQKEYAKQIKNIILFFEGNKDKLIKNLKKEMAGFAKSREFEKAQKVKRQIFALYHIQDVSLIKENSMSRLNLDTKFRIESYDIAHLSGTNVVGVMMVMENSEIKKSDYRKFKIKSNPGVNDTKALMEVLTRRLAHTEWPFPDLIVVDGGVAQKNAMEKILKEKGLDIPVVSVVKDEHHKPKEILGTTSLLASLKLRGINSKSSELEKEILLCNTEAHRFAIGFHKQLRRKF
jgi:excinuclease ABC subunit C